MFLHKNRYVFWTFLFVFVKLQIFFQFSILRLEIEVLLTPRVIKKLKIIARMLKFFCILYAWISYIIILMIQQNYFQICIYLNF